MPDIKKNQKTDKPAPVKPTTEERAEERVATKSVYAKKQLDRQKMRRGGGRGDRPVEEYEQRIVNVARVTRVMAGGKRMRFRACVAIGNRKGKVGLGIEKGADVTAAVTKAVNQAKKAMIDVPIMNETIPHEIYHKFGAAKVLLKPARRGKGVIAGGAARIIIELSGLKNVSAKNLGTNNAINVAKCAVAALANLKKVETKKEVKTNEGEKKAEEKKEASDNKEIKKLGN
jgi:small subunit ribosomal protein S5